MLIDAGARTDLGRVRKNNEDAFHIEPALDLYVLSDGMGGQAHGEVGVLVRIRGVCRPFELAMQIADLQRQENSQDKTPAKDGTEEGAGMKPFRTRDGRLIVDQLCRCGHLQSRHGHRLAELPDTLIGVPRHGPCLEDGCACERFSFKDFVYREEEK